MARAIGLYVDRVSLSASVLNDLEKEKAMRARPQSITRGNETPPPEDVEPMPGVSAKGALVCWLVVALRRTPHRAVRKKAFSEPPVFFFFETFQSMRVV